MVIFMRTVVVLFLSTYSSIPMHRLLHTEVVDITL
jgi:hypothetical protein